MFSCEMLHGKRILRALCACVTLCMRSKVEENTAMRAPMAQVRNEKLSNLTSTSLYYHASFAVFKVYLAVVPVDGWPG